MEAEKKVKMGKDLMKKLNTASEKKKEILTEMAKPKCLHYLDSDEEDDGSLIKNRSNKLMSQSAVQSRKGGTHDNFFRRD